MKQRVSRGGLESLELRPSIAGLFKHKSLRDGGSFRSAFDGLSRVLAGEPEIWANISICEELGMKLKRSKSELRSSHITADEIAMLLFYTISYDDGWIDFHRLVNSSLYQQTESTNGWNTRSLVQVVDVIWLMMHALAKCPAAKMDDYVYCFAAQSTCETSYSAEDVFAWRQFVSCASVSSVSTFMDMYGYSDSDEKGATAVFKIKVSTASCKDISHFQFERSNLKCGGAAPGKSVKKLSSTEVVFPPNTRFKVVGKERVRLPDQPCDIIVIELMELLPHDPIFRFGQQLPKVAASENLVGDVGDLGIGPLLSLESISLDGEGAVDTEEEDDCVDESASMGVDTNNNASDYLSNVKLVTERTQEEDIFASWLHTNTNITVRRAYEYAVLLIDYYGIKSYVRLKKYLCRRHPQLLQILGFDELDAEEIYVALGLQRSEDNRNQPTGTSETENLGPDLCQPCRLDDTNFVLPVGSQNDRDQGRLFFIFHYFA
jgi:hypothetical protein